MAAKIYGLIIILLLALMAVWTKMFVFSLENILVSNQMTRLPLSVLMLMVTSAVLGGVTVKVWSLKTIKKTATFGVKIFVVCFLSTFLATHSQCQIVYATTYPVGRLDTKSVKSVTALPVEAETVPVSDLIQNGPRPVQLLSAPLDELPDMMTLTNEVSLAVTTVSTIGYRTVTNLVEKTVSLFLAGSTNALKVITVFNNGLVRFQAVDGSTYIAKPKSIFLVCLAVGGGIAILVWIWLKSRIACSNLQWTLSNSQWLATNVVSDDAFVFSPPPAQPLATKAALPNICPITGSCGKDMLYSGETRVIADVSAQGWTLGDGVTIPVTKVTQEMLYRIYPTNIMLVDTNTGAITPCVFEYCTDMAKADWKPAVGLGGTVVSFSKWYTSTASTWSVPMPCMTVLFIGGVPCYTNISLSTVNEGGIEIEKTIGFVAGMPRMPGQGKDQAYFRLRPLL